MEALMKEQEALVSTGDLSKTFDNIDKIISQMTQARDSIAESMNMSFNLRSVLI